MITLYGIRNCDTVKKARKWLEEREVDYRFHDVREEGLDRDTVAIWLQALGWETLVNKRSTTWKGLDQGTRESMNDTTALEVIVEHPTLFKRPVLDTGHELHCGFSAANYQTIFNHHTL